MEKNQARHVIETLRAGVPSPEVSSVLMQGQARLLARSRQDLLRVAEGHGASLIIRGQYGEGKSHLLSAIENLAKADNFAVSRVVISKETPFNRINKVYEAVAHAVRAKNLPRDGFEDIVLRLRPGTGLTDDVLNYTEKHLHKKIYYVFRNYLKEGDPLKRAQLYDDLAGAAMTMADLRAIHRGNFHEAMPVPRRFLIQQDTVDYFRFLSFLLRRAGYRGWVILFDELELLSKLGIGSRAQAYVNLATLLGARPHPPLEGAYTVLALASPFVPDILQAGGRNDLAKISEWLADSRRNRASDVPWAKASMQSLVERSEPLDLLTEQDIGAILAHLEELHSLAYGWEASMDKDFVRAKALVQPSNPTRTTIRAALEYLDLFYQYGERPDIEVRAPDIDSLQEDVRFEEQNAPEDR